MDRGEPFGDYVARKLAEQGLTQTAAADAMGVSKSMVNSWVHGSRKPSPENVGRLAALLTIPTDELQARAGYRVPEQEETDPRRLELIEVARRLPLTELGTVLDFARWRMQVATRRRPRGRGDGPAGPSATDTGDDPARR